MRIVGEMTWHPVDDHGKPGAVAGIDQGCKICRSAEPARGREQSRRLIAPGAVERVLAHRQKFDMREAHLLA